MNGSIKLITADNLILDFFNMASSESAIDMPRDLPLILAQNRRLFPIFANVRKKKLQKWEAIEQPFLASSWNNIGVCAGTFRAHSNRQRKTFSKKEVIHGAD